MLDSYQEIGNHMKKRDEMEFGAYGGIYRVLSLNDPVIIHLEPLYNAPRNPTLSGQVPTVSAGQTAATQPQTKSKPERPSNTCSNPPNNFPNHQTLNPRQACGMGAARSGNCVRLT